MSLDNPFKSEIVPLSVLLNLELSVALLQNCVEIVSGTVAIKTDTSSELGNLSPVSGQMESVHAGRNTGRVVPSK